MATTVGATLASSKLAVTQDDLHLIGSSVDQLNVQFDQMDFDKLLFADKIRAGKGRRPKNSKAAMGATPLSFPTRSALPSNDEPIRAAAPFRTHQSTERREVPWGSL